MVVVPGVVDVVAVVPESDFCRVKLRPCAADGERSEGLYDNPGVINVCEVVVVVVVVVVVPNPGLAPVWESAETKPWTAEDAV